MTATALALQHTCPHCGRRNDAATGINAPIPTPGAVSICFYCSGVALFYNGPLGMATRLPSPQEQDAIATDPQVQQVLRALAAGRARGET